jgi:tetratricopeptide (TPR) repeat protein
MLYAKALLMNRKYREADQVLSQLKIIPFEGATEGRQLYREAKLMEAIVEMKNKNFNKALAFVGEAKLWPENLGEGKPYEKDIDERLENWMSYICYSKLGKAKEANTSLQKIMDFDLQTENTLSGNYSANALITAWAMQKSGKATEALAWLDDQIKDNPDNSTLKWAKESFENKHSEATGNNDPTLRIIQASFNLISY